MESQQRIAFFDFDGTLTKSDSLKHFLLWYFKWPKLVQKTVRFLPYFLFFKIFKSDNSRVKEKLFQIFFKGTETGLFNAKCTEFAKKVIPQLIKKEAQNRLQWHLKRGDVVVIVSASIENYLIPAFNTQSISVIGTRLEVIDGKITGNFIKNNCYGPEKVRRIREEYDLSTFSKIYSYGDSKGDRELLQLADYSFYRKFQ